MNDDGLFPAAPAEDGRGLMTDQKLPAPPADALIAKTIGFIEKCREIRNGSPNAFYAMVDSYCRQITALTAAHPPTPEKLSDEIEDNLLKFALHQHMVLDGEYGCPGATCPGVQKLVAFGRRCIQATALSAAQNTKEEAARFASPQRMLTCEDFDGSCCKCCHSDLELEMHEVESRKVFARVCCQKLQQAQLREQGITAPLLSALSSVRPNAGMNDGLLALQGDLIARLREIAEANLRDSWSGDALLIDANDALEVARKAYALGQADQLTAQAARLRELPNGDATETLKKIALLAMTAQSNPYAPAKQYRAALIEICNRALATLDRGAKSDGQTSGLEETARPSGADPTQESVSGRGRSPQPEEEEHDER